MTETTTPATTDAITRRHALSDELAWLDRMIEIRAVEARLQNLFNEDEAWVLRRGTDTNDAANVAVFRSVFGTNDAEIVRRTRMREPRTWRLTANFDF